ncbi:TPA: hypothetical protein DCW61_04445 [Candidatus Uhrbacteria bacterium]|nr:hypothetical protein [Candidatus Uhrbacteria bacterium]
MQIIRRILFLPFLSMVVLLGIFTYFSVSLAAGPTDICDCYCTSIAGAVTQSQKMISQECQTTCKAKGQTVAAFACTANQHPSRSISCFTQEQCADQSGILDSHYQPPECPSGYHYCFPDPKNNSKISLAVSIGGLTSTNDLGEYVAKVYQWMIGSATVIAIVFLMVAGLRWVLGAGSSEQIGKAKTQIRNAILGLVLLLSSYLILYTVNPQLLKMTVPRFPLIKTVSLVDNASCDELIKEGYKVEYKGPEACGTVGTVKNDPDGNAVADGIVCNFSYCDNQWEVCIPGEKPECMRCEELTADNTVLIPTPSLCAAFNQLKSYETEQGVVQVNYTTGGGALQKTVSLDEVQVQTYEQCFYTRDPDAGGELTGRGACARLYLDCGDIKSCEDYDKAPVFTKSSSGPVTLDSVDVGRNSGLPGTDSGAGKMLYDGLGELTLGSMCANLATADMCAWNRTESKQACYIDSTNIDAITSSVLSALTTTSYNCKTSPDTSSWWYQLTE